MESECGDESRSTANFFEDLPCWKVIGLDDVKISPPFSHNGFMLSYTKSANISPHPTVVSLQRAHKSTRAAKPLNISYEAETNTQECLHTFKWGVQLPAYVQVGRATGGQKAARSPWILNRFLSVHCI